MRHGGNVWQGDGPQTWTDFSANLRPEGPPQWVRRVLAEAVNEVRYYPQRSMEAAQAGLAAYAGVTEGRILPCAGGIAAIDLALSVRKGRVLTQALTFGEYALRARVHGRQTAVYPCAIEPGDTIVLCNPSNPTGEVQTREQVLNLHRLAVKQGAELVVDEAFIDFCPEHSVRSDVQPGLTVVGSLTKTLCIPGVRLGYLCADEARIAQLKERALPWSLGALAAAVSRALPEHLGEIALDARENARRRERFADRLTALGVKVLPSQANFLLADFGQNMNEGQRMLRERGILVRDCASFGLGPQWLRLAVKTQEENDRLADELRKMLTEKE